MLVTALLVEVLFQLLVLYSLLLFVRVLLTWIPSVPWDKPGVGRPERRHGSLPQPVSAA